MPRIKAAKGTYAEKIQGHLCDTGNTKWMWQGVQVLTDYKSRQGVNDDDASLPDRLNNLFARFEAPNLRTRGRADPSPLAVGPALTINAADKHRTLTRVNPQKAGGLYNISARVLRTCAGELADVLTDIFIISLSQAIVPRCIKTSTIILVEKKSVVPCLNNYRPVTLTPIVMKCFERLVKHTSQPASGHHMTPFCPNRFTEDTLHSVITLIWTKKTTTPKSCTLSSAQHSIPSSPRNSWRNSSYSALTLPHVSGSRTL